MDIFIFFYMQTSCWTITACWRCNIFFSIFFCFYDLSKLVSYSCINWYLGFQLNSIDWFVSVYTNNMFLIVKDFSTTWNQVSGYFQKFFYCSWLFQLFCYLLFINMKLNNFLWIPVKIEFEWCILMIILALFFLFMLLKFWLPDIFHFGSFY